MWVPESTADRAWLAAGVAAVSVGYAGYSLGIFKHAYISWRARKLPGWKGGQRNSTLGSTLSRAVTGNMRELVGEGLNKFHVRLKAGADEHGGLYRARILSFSVSCMLLPQSQRKSNCLSHLCTISIHLFG